MAGKFNLLTVMTLNAAGYKSGIDDAKKSTKGLVTGTTSAVNSIGSQFGKLGGMAASVVAPLSGINGAVIAGISSFRAMIPAINGIKVALVSTGIGAIVVALGLAFVALTSYLGGTSEGSKKLREMLGFVSGAVTALMNRVKYLGSALFSLITGDIQGFKDSIKEAFAGGFFDEVKKAAQESNDIEKQKSANILIQRNLKTQISELEVKSARLNQQFRDPKLTDGERLKYLEQMLDVEDSIASTKKHAAQAELKYRQDIVAMKGFSATGEDKDAVADAKVAINTIEIERINAGTRTQRMQAKLLASEQKANDESVTSYQKMINEKIALQTEAEKEAKDLTDAVEEYQSESENNIVDAMNARISKGLAAQFEYLDKLDETQKSFADRNKSQYQLDLENYKQLLSEKLITDEQYATAVKEIKREELAQTLGNFATMSSSMSDMFGEQTAAHKAFAIASIQLNAAIAIMGAWAGSAEFGPWGIAMAVAETAIIAAVATAQSAKVAGATFANGGIVGGSAFSGDKVHAMVNSGEMILNKTQQSNLFAMANGNGSTTGGEVTFKIKGTELIGVLNNQAKKINNTR